MDDLEGDLKSCPFCDGLGLLKEWNEDGDTWYRVFCSGCGCQRGMDSDNEQEARKIWNVRARR